MFFPYSPAAITIHAFHAVLLSLPISLHRKKLASCPPSRLMNTSAAPFLNPSIHSQTEQTLDLHKHATTASLLIPSHLISSHLDQPNPSIILKGVCQNAQCIPTQLFPCRPCCLASARKTCVDPESCQRTKYAASKPNPEWSVCLPTGRDGWRSLLRSTALSQRYSIVFTACEIRCVLASATRPATVSKVG